MSDRNEAIKAGIAKLDANKDEHWNDDGKPSLGALKSVMKDSTVSAAEVTAAAPDAKRPANDPANKDDTENAAAKKREETPPMPKDVLERQEAKSKERQSAIEKTAKKIEDHDDYVEGQNVMTLDIGHYGNAIRTPGEVFSYTGILGSWMRKATKDEVKAYQKFLASK